MVEEMDKGIGEIVQALKEKQLDSNTLIWFFSDNGANGQGNNGGLRGTKGSLWEGGHRVPSIAYWPGKIKPNTKTDALSITLDVFPTVTQFAGVESNQLPELDGKDLSNLMMGKQEAKSDRTLFWGFGNQRAMRQGEWKLIQNPPRSKESIGLFNLANDRNEQVNLAGENPERVKRMVKAISEWDQDVGPSSFPKKNNDEAAKK